MNLNLYEMYDQMCKQHLQRVNDTFSSMIVGKRIGANLVGSHVYNVFMVLRILEITDATMTLLVETDNEPEIVSILSDNIKIYE